MFSGTPPPQGYTYPLPLLYPRTYIGNTSESHLHLVLELVLGTVLVEACGNYHRLLYRFAVRCMVF